MRSIKEIGGLADLKLGCIEYQYAFPARITNRVDVDGCSPRIRLIPKIRLNVPKILWTKTGNSGCKKNFESMITLP